MSEEINFIYGKEYWFVSLFYNSREIKINERLQELKHICENKVKNLSSDDLSAIKWNEKWVEDVKELGRNMFIDLKYEDVIDYFPYYDENLNILFDRLGIIRFEVEYYKGNEEQKKKIKPIYVQQIPTIILNELKDYNNKKTNEYISFDTESPIYVFLFSYKMIPGYVKWSSDNIEKYKRVIGSWNEVYQGSWPDYHEELYSERVQNNLSNRLSELHYIKRNSGFIYMEEENFKRFFNYINENVMNPTARIRAIKFALMSINTSLGIISKSQSLGLFTSLDKIENKMKSLKEIRVMIQTELGEFFNEVDYNRRQHYTNVLNHLIKIFNLGPNGIMDRMKEKFDAISDSINFLYQKKQEEISEKTEKRLNLLNYLFGLGIVADFISLIIAAAEKSPYIESLSIILNSIGSIVIGVVVIYLFYILIKEKIYKKQEKKPLYAVDGVILDKNKQNIVLIIRKNPPFKGEYALPGGFIEEKEKPEDTIIREIKEETNLDIKIIKKIGVYDKPGRDPRGNIISHAFLCEAEDLKLLEASSDARETIVMPLQKAKEIDLAFDHEDILKDALKLIS